MIKIDNIEYRNLEEQVLKNKEDIANHYNMDRVLANFGIRIIGTLPNAADLPDPFNGQYGDAYAVGDQAPYDFYIWTRADINAGHAEDYWFYLGSLAIVGPKGEQGKTGPKGDTGERGSIWMSAPRNPDSIVGYLPGDQWLNTTNGNVYTIKEYDGTPAWASTGNIRGPQGAQGPQGQRGLQGEQGPRGLQGPKGEGAEIVQIVGTITSIDQLPNPEETLQTNAYLQDVGGAWHLWVIVGQAGTYQWLDTGSFTVGTRITDDGEPILDWDIKNVLEGPFNEAVAEMSYIGDPRPVSGVVCQTYNKYGTEEITEYSIRQPVVARESVPVLGGTTKLAQFDSMGRIGAIAGNKAADYTVKDVPKAATLEKLGFELPDHFATPRAYVDAQIQYAAQGRLPYPQIVPANTDSVLMLTADRTIAAVRPEDVHGILSSVKVDCQIVKRGEYLDLPRDKMYLIRGYGNNTVRLVDTTDNSTILSNATMVMGMISSSLELTNPAANKAWAGFFYQTSSLSFSWNGDTRGSVRVHNDDTSTSGSGFMYVYSLGA